jgi:hypothetical protein
MPVQAHSKGAVEEGRAARVLAVMRALAAAAGTSVAVDGKQLYNNCGFYYSTSTSTTVVLVVGIVVLLQ